jgi:hypothetical protein
VPARPSGKGSATFYDLPLVVKVAYRTEIILTEREREMHAIGGYRTIYIFF